MAPANSQEFSLFFFRKMKSVSPIICKFNLVAATDASCFVFEKKISFDAVMTAVPFVLMP